jgi:hypothetical protein
LNDAGEIADRDRAAGKCAFEHSPGLSRITFGGFD